MAEPLTDVEQKALDLVTEGGSTRTVGVAVDRSNVWVHRLIHSERGQAYLLARLSPQLTGIGSRVLGQIVERLDWGSVPLPYLIALAKLSLPYVVAEQPKRLIVEEARAEAEKLAGEMGLDPVEMIALAEQIAAGRS
jgi:hypothetical protein